MKPIPKKKKPLPPKKTKTLTVEEAIKEVLSLSEKDRPKAADEVKARLNLDELYNNPKSALRLCRMGKCRLCDTPNLNHPLIMGIGPEPAKLMLVGEAPGEKEDYAGQPFIGRSGQELKAMLEDAGIMHVDEDVFITNAVRCRPPENRDPSVAEIKACSGFLKAELRNIKPNLVLTLGNTPLRALYGKTGITSLRGIEMWSSEFNVKFLPTIHPASILYGNSQFEIWVGQDIKKAVRCCDSPKFTPFETPEITVPKTITDVDKLVDLLLEQEEFSFDLETSGLNPFVDNAHILCLAFSWDAKKAGVIYLDHPDNTWSEEEWKHIVGRLEELFTSPVKKIGHNVKFDAKWVEAVLKVKVLNISFDTMLAHYSFSEFKGTQGLKQMAADYLNFPEYDLETEFLKGIPKDKRYYGAIPLEPLCKYSALDANATFRLKSLLQREMIDKKSSTVFKTLLMPLSHRLIPLEMEGIRLDLDYLTILERDMEMKLEDIDAELLTYASGIKLQEWCEEHKKKINFNSDDQVRLLLFKFEGLRSMYSTPTGKGKVDQDTLEAMAGQTPLTDKLIERSHIATLQSHFVRKMWVHLVDGKVHPSYLIHGTETGRLSCADPNYQNIPREGYIKKMFIGDTPDFLYVDADYCLAEGTKVITEFGLMSIEDIVRKKPAVLSCREGKTVEFNKVTKGIYVGKKEVYELTLEDTSVVRCTEEHEWMLYGGVMKKTKDLCVGERLAHVKESYISRKKYPTWYLRSNRNYQPKHKVLANYLFGKTPRGMNVDHIDGDVQNITSGNLRLISEKENKGQGAKTWWTRATSIEKKKKIEQIIKGQKENRRSYVGEGNPNYGKLKGQINICLQCGKEFYVYPCNKEKRYCCFSCYTLARKRNHRVKSIVFVGEQNVYQITVENLHNYVLSNGLVSGNSQIELRVIASLSGDMAMRGIFSRGEDIHTAMAAKIFNKSLEEVTKDERYRAKTMNFSILYGKGPYTVATDLKITADEAKAFIDQFFKEVPGVQKWIRETQNSVRKTGVVRSPFGRIRHISEARSTDRARAAKALREAVNMPIQSAASDITATAFLKLADIFEKEKFKSRLVGLIHDSISFVVHKRELKRIIPIIKETMEGAKFSWMTVPITVEIKVGPSWGETEAV